MRRIFLLFAVVMAFLMAQGCIGLGKGNFSFGGKVGLVEIKGVIVEPDDVVEDLEDARKDRDIKAVVVRVDSPGGSIGASQEIFRTIGELDKKKPVIISMGDVAASGGYYVSASARKIFANEGTITGSLGVRMEHMNAGGFLDLIRLQPETLKSGKYKDIGSVYRALTPEEREILEGLLAELHDQFKADIARSRNLDIEFVNKIADGRVYTGAKAREMGLVDDIGGLVDAVKEAARMAGIKGEPRVTKIREAEPWWYQFVTEKAGVLIGKLTGNAPDYRYFMYEWKP